MKVRGLAGLTGHIGHTGAPTNGDGPFRVEKPGKLDKAARLALKEERAAARDAEKEAAKGSGRADKAAENMFRIVHAKHEQLSAMADGKAHSMLTICVAVVGVSATQVFDPQLQYAALALIATSLVAAGFAVYATMPSLTRHTQVEHKHPSFNLIFFGDFSRLPLDVYLDEMEAFVKDRPAMDRALARDLYFLGKVLNEKKYRYLAYCYRVFFGGLLLSAIVLLVTVAVNLV